MTDNTPGAKSRAVLLLVGGIPLTMILAATWLWYFVMQGDLDLVSALGTANRGTLVQPPRQLDEHNLSDDRGQALRYSELEPRWTLLIPGANGVCDATCENSLYTTRQIHIAMGKGFNRLRRVYVSEQSALDTILQVSALSDQRPAPADFAQYLANDHRGLKAFTLPPGDANTLFPEYFSDASTWYLVDTAGWIMMSYNSDIPYKDVMSDLKFLLKNSGG
jgi:hypothetical protein